MRRPEPEGDDVSRRFGRGAGVCLAMVGMVFGTASRTSASAEDVTVTFWNYWDGTNGEAMQALADRYSEEHPGVTVENVFIGWGDLLPKLQAAVAGGEAPDVAALDLVWMPQIIGSDRVVALDDYVEAGGVDLSDVYPEILSVDQRDDALYGLPLSANNLELFINRDLFAAAGLDPDQPPTTWEELREAAQQCTDSDDAVYGMELYTEPGEGLTWQYQVYLWQAGGEFLNEDNTAAAFNSPEGEAALQLWIDLLHADESAPLAPWGQFGQGAACMVMDGSWMVGGLTADPPFGFSTATMPFPADGGPATNMGGEHGVVFANDDPATEQAAFDFLAWLSSAEVQEEWDLATGFTPTRAAVAESPTYLEAVERDLPQLLPFVENQQYARSRPSIANYAEVSDAFSRALEPALLGNTDAASALADAEAAVNDLLADR
jgi:multiple sugar transport system substrate-binding protein